MISVDAVAAAWRGAVVVLDAGTDRQMVRAAAHVYEIAGGVAWLEPSYADPFGSPVPAWHERRGTVAAVGDALRVTTADGQTVDLVPYDAGQHADMVDGALKWFAGWLKSQGLTWADERDNRKPGDLLA